MNRRISRPLVTGAAVAAWTVLGLDAVLTDHQVDITDGMSMLAGCIAVASSLVIAGWARSRPVAEVYDMAYEAGKRAARVEDAVTRSSDVLPFRSRRSG